MGDNRRAHVFANWLVTNFSPEHYPRVADLAGGKGKVSRELEKHGYQPIVFDRRKESQQGKKYRRRKRDLQAHHFKKGEFDLVIGMHPDEITWHVIRLDHENKSPFVVVPCCIKPPKQKSGIQIDTFRQWLNWLRQEAINMGFSVQQTTLNIKGKNILLYGTKSP